jgi:hypothetical protein
MLRKASAVVLLAVFGVSAILGFGSPRTALGSHNVDMDIFAVAGLVSAGPIGDAQWEDNSPTEHYVKAFADVKYCDGADCKTYHATIETDGDLVESGSPAWPIGFTIFGGSSFISGSDGCGSASYNSGCQGMIWYAITAPNDDKNSRDIESIAFRAVSTGAPDAFENGDCDGTVLAWLTAPNSLYSVEAGESYVKCYTVEYEE